MNGLNNLDFLFLKALSSLVWFVSKVSVFPSEVTFICSALGRLLALPKYQTRLEKPVRNKHSSLLGPFVLYKNNEML